MPHEQPARLVLKRPTTNHLVAREPNYAMQIGPFPAETQQAEYGVTVDGKRFNETTGDRLVEMPHVPRAYDNQEASAIQRA